MTARRITGHEPDETPRRAATTRAARERQMVNLAVEAAEKQMRNGTAPAQIITHYLKLGSSREMLEQERLSHEVKLLEAKREQMQSQARVEEMYDEVLNALRRYSGNGDEEVGYD